MTESLHLLQMEERCIRINRAQIIINPTTKNGNIRLSCVRGFFPNRRAKLTSQLLTGNAGGAVIENLELLAWYSLLQAVVKP